MARARAGLVSDPVGNLYGTTAGGGTQSCDAGYTGCGTVFELSPPLQTGGEWTETVLYNFCSNILANLSRWFYSSSKPPGMNRHLYGTR